MEKINFKQLDSYYNDGLSKKVRAIGKQRLKFRYKNTFLYKAFVFFVSDWRIGAITTFGTPVLSYVWRII